VRDSTAWSTDRGNRRRNILIIFGLLLGGYVIAVGASVVFRGDGSDPAPAYRGHTYSSVDQAVRHWVARMTNPRPLHGDFVRQCNRLTESDNPITGEPEDVYRCTVRRRTRREELGGSGFPTGRYMKPCYFVSTKHRLYRVETELEKYPAWVLEQAASSSN
jgi:hypothetical protein